jgi:anti-sigma regulatory factor (Ser/Thr protein kinase)
VTRILRHSTTIGRPGELAGVGRFGRLAASGLLPLQADEGGRAVVLFDGETIDGIDDLLCPPANWAIDVGCDPGETGMHRMPARLLVQVATSVAVRHDVVGMVVDALARRLPRLDALGIDIRLALQEAVGNAVMHGNLSLDGRLREHRDGLSAFTEAMRLRLDDPRYARRPVTIAADWNSRFLVIRVEDRGPGFTPPATSPPLTAAACCGRGLGQIRLLCQRVTFSNRGRRIAMRFPLPAAAGLQPTT